MFSVGIPTLNRLDMLYRCIDSLVDSGVDRDRIYIIDNGGVVPFTHNVYFPRENLGVAKSWNWFIDNTSDPWLITNDDIGFNRNIIQELCGLTEPGIYSPEGIHADNFFSCFFLFKEVVDKIGKFDEKISPNYAYFEDNDYARRAFLGNIKMQVIPNTTVEHFGSATLKNYTSKEMTKHHRKFELAKKNYSKKWGGLPGKETLVNPRDL